jgi:predicted adenylyl cyclase CyaB
MLYEVERRVKRNLKDNLPSEAKLKRVFDYIVDTYYTFPDPMLRVRYAELSFPKHRVVENVCMKVNDKEIKEFETSIGDSKCLGKIFNYVIGKPKIVVEGRREEYKFRNATICFDHVESLGYWAEVEVMAKSFDEIIKASEEVESVFKILGVNKNELIIETYPELLYKKQYEA